LFPAGTLPSHPPPPIAPACRECQQRVQPDEEYFRTFAAAGAYADEAARALWEGKIARSFDNSPGFRQLFASRVDSIEWRSPGGVVMGDLSVVKGDERRIGHVLNKIVRGMSYLDSGGKVMPFDVKFRFEQVTPMTEPMPDVVMDVIHATELRTVGDIVRYKFQLLPGEPRLMVAWFAFYNPASMFVVWTRPADKA
jgi:hypothetical protein